MATIQWTTLAISMSNELSQMPAGSLLVQEGNALVDALQAAGNAYNATLYQVSAAATGTFAAELQKWAAIAEPVFMNLDQGCRFAYSLLSGSATPMQKAAFGLPAAAASIAWQASTAYVGSGAPPIVSPTTTPGPFYFSLVPCSGTTGSGPSWNVAENDVVIDGSASWNASIIVGSGSTPVPLEWDPTLQNKLAIGVRSLHTQALATAAQRPELAQTIGGALSEWLKIQGRKPQVVLGTAQGNSPPIALTPDADLQTATADLLVAIAQCQQWMATAPTFQ